MCGEHVCGIQKLNLKIGSSPHVRGTRQYTDGYFASWRFIPACAGNTPGIYCALTAPPVHPRMCGEHPPKGSAVRRMTGSSPHVRGTHRQLSPSSLWCRFIPACAGNTTQLSILLDISTVHPRMCGEHIVSGLGKGSSIGSSPHVRGTRSVITK